MSAICARPDCGQPEYYRGYCGLDCKNIHESYIDGRSDERTRAAGIIAQLIDPGFPEADAERLARAYIAEVDRDGVASLGGVGEAARGSHPSAPIRSTPVTLS